MAGRALLAGYHRFESWNGCGDCELKCLLSWPGFVSQSRDILVAWGDRNLFNDSSNFVVMNFFAIHVKQDGWHHDMETYYALLSLCGGMPPISGGFPPIGPVMRSFDVAFLLSWYNCSTSSQVTGDVRETPGSSYKVTVTIDIVWRC